MHAQSRKVTFAGSLGAQLQGRLELPAYTPRAYALFAHCFTCSKDSRAAFRVSRALASEGIAVLRFDFTGLGSSDGDFSNTDFSSNVDDLVAAANHLREHFTAPSLLIGHSLGGAAVLAATERIPETKAVCTINAPADPSHVRHLFAEANDEIRQQGEAVVQLAGRSFRIRKEFLDDVETTRLAQCVRRLGVPLLLFHGPKDETVGVENARQLFDAAKHPKSFVSLDDADHLVSRDSDAAYIAGVLAAWADRYVPAQSRTELPGGEVLVREEGTGRYIQQATLGRHTLLSDEPTDVGGNDAGPSPYELLLAALGTCTSMTLRMYANHKQLALDRVSVRLRHQKVHAQDCDECETRVGKLDRIDRHITLEGDLDEATRRRLLEIADKCPVHRTLHSEVLIRTQEESETEA